MSLGWYGWRNNYGIPTPELGISETLQQILQPNNKNLTKDNGSTLGLGSGAEQTLNQRNADYQNALTRSGSYATQQPVSNYPTSAPATGGTGGFNNLLAAPTGDTGGGLDEVALAELARQNRINSAKAQAGQYRGEGQGVFDNILKAVNAFRERNQNLFNTAGQAITNTASGLLGSNARTAREASGEARARGRSMGLGDSSKFNLQNKVQGNLASTQGNTIARRGEEDRNNQNLFDERSDTAQGQEDQANTYLKGVNEKAGLIERAGYDTANETFEGALNDIVNYQRQLAAISPVQAGGLTQYAPNFSGITNTLNNMLPGQTANTATQEAGNPVNPTDYLSLLKRKGLYA